jgi:Tfp pilus assembly protein PilF
MSDKHICAIPKNQATTSHCGRSGRFVISSKSLFFSGRIMKLPARLLCALLAATTVSATGCRAIRRIGDSRQSITARRLSGQGFQAMRDGQWSTAETLFSDALHVSDTDDRAHWGLAETYWKRSEKDLAIEHMEQAVRLSAGDPKLVRRLGRMYLELGRLEEANEQSRWAIESKRDVAEAWALRGDCLGAAGEADEALAAYHRALALQPNYPEVQLQAAEIYREQGRYDRLLATLDSLQDGAGAEYAPARVDLLQGVAMRQLGHCEEARRCFVRAAAKDKEDATPHQQLASLAMERGDAEAAQRELDWVDQLKGQHERVAIRPAEDGSP